MYSRKVIETQGAAVVTLDQVVEALEADSSKRLLVYGTVYVHGTVAEHYLEGELLILRRDGDVEVFFVPVSSSFISATKNNHWHEGTLASVLTVAFTALTRRDHFLQLVDKEFWLQEVNNLFKNKK